MKATAFDGISRELGQVSTRRGFLGLLGGAAIGSGFALVAREESSARAKGRSKARGRGENNAQIEAKGKKITVCYQGQTRTVAKKKLQQKYPGATKGACAGGQNQNAVCTSWIISGGPDRTTPISVDDDLRITVNGVNVLNDTNKMAENLPAVPFAAKVGDSLAITAFDDNPACRSISPLWLHCATTNQKRQLSAGQNDGCAPGRTAGTFFSQVYTISL